MRETESTPFLSLHLPPQANVVQLSKKTHILWLWTLGLSPASPPLAVLVLRLGPNHTPGLSGSIAAGSLSPCDSVLLSPS